jgi:hypothetical protein
MGAAMSILDCLLQNLPFILIGIGLVLLGFIIAAVIAVAAAGTGGTAGAFAAAVLATLASWWIPIAVSLFGNLVLAYQLCADQVNAPDVQITAGAVTGITAGLTAIAVHRWTIRFKLSKP